MLNSNLVKQLGEKAQKFGQGHIFRFWEELSYQSQKKLIDQIQSIDFNLMLKLKKNYLDHPKDRFFSGTLEPPKIIPIPKNKQQKQDAEEAKKIGEKLLTEGKVGAILVAGGQGTRLGFNGPKGLFKIGPISGKTLYQLFAERIYELTKKYATNIPWLIMTSETNHQETVDYFSEKDFFGLNLNDIYFFKQGMIPALDTEGLVFLDAKDHIFTNPNGHGGTLYALRDSGCLEEMKRRGIEELFYFQIDNVLIKICDPIFIGYHHQDQADMSLKVVAKRDPYEKVGVVGKVDGGLTVIEYSDLPDSEKEARNPDGSFKYRGGSIAIHVFKREFLEEESSQAKLPYHLAHKKIPFIDKTGKLTQPAVPNGYKFEMFIFDALKDAERAVIMEVDRTKEFSPVKNKRGIDSAKTARRDLVNYYRYMLEETGVKIPSDFSPDKSLIEISANFALDVEDLKKKIDPSKFNVEFPLLLED